MRKLFNLLAAALVVLAAAGCDKNENLFPDSQEGKVITLSATIDNGGTKTSLGDPTSGEYPVHWSTNDQIALIQGTNVCVLTLSNGENTTTATFTGTITNDFNLGEDYTAFYPASAVNINTGAITISGTQIYAENSFGQVAMPMMAEESNGSLTFSNLFGVLKLQLKGNVEVSKIRVIGNNVLNGNVTVIDGTLSMQSSGDTYKSVNLNFSENEKLSTEQAKNFLIAVPSGKHDFTVAITSSDGRIYCKKTNKKDIVVGNILKMSELDLSQPLNPYIEGDSNLGDGVALATKDGNVIIWAPVNCGYDGQHKGGLLYQWGRKYGQGYGPLEEDPDVEIVPNRETLAAGNDENNKNKFYTGNYNDGSWGDWLVPADRNPELWNKGTEDVPEKNETYDPCPEGWRVPTYNELVTLWVGELKSGSYESKLPPEGQMVQNKVSGDLHYNLYGFWAKSEEGVNQVFFPAHRFRNYSDGACSNAATSSCYWSSAAGNSKTPMSKVLIISCYSSDPQYNTLQITERSRACGYSIRCVKE